MIQRRFFHGSAAACASLAVLFATGCGGAKSASNEVSEVSYVETSSDGSRDIIEPGQFDGDLDPSVIDTANRLKSAGWASVQDTPIQVVVASDVPTEIRRAAEDGFRAAEARLGSFGPLKVFIIGNELGAAEPLVDEFCEWSYEPADQEYCQQDQGNDMREMATIFPGGNGFAQHSWYIEEPTQAFVHNPYADEENQFAGVYDPEELLNERRVSAHEYFHIYQEAHLIYRSHDPDIDQFDGVRWFNEGTATFFEMYLSEMEGWSVTDREDTINRLIEEAANGSEQWPMVGLADIETEAGVERTNEVCGEPCIGHLQYNVGGLATAYLAAQTSDEAVIYDFWPASTEQGFYRAFEETFVMTVEDFYADFDQFSSLPAEEQREFLLP